MEENMFMKRLYFRIYIFIFIINFFLISQYIAQSSDTFTPVLDDSIAYSSKISDFPDLSDEIIADEDSNPKTHRISISFRGSGKHQIFGNKYNDSLPIYSIVNKERSYILNKEIWLNNSYTTVIFEWKEEIFDCSYMFSGLSTIENINFTEFNFKRIINMTCMFCNNNNLKYIEFGNLDTSSVISMEKMFYECISLISLDLSSFKMNKVENIDSMFEGCSQLNNIIFSQYKTKSLKSMNRAFYYSYSLTSLDLSNFDISEVSNMNYLFYRCERLISLNLSSFHGNKYYIDASNMFYNCWNLKNIYFSEINAFHLSDMKYMFYNCQNLLSLDLSNFETSKVINMAYMFYQCYNLKEVKNMKFNLSSVISMNSMFYCCHSIESIDLSNFFESKKSLDMSYMFYHSYNLKYVKFPKFRLSNINNMRAMFYQCSAIKSLNIYNLDTSLVTNMANMFYNCYNLISLNITTFNTSLVENMDYMFYYCYNLKTIDLSGFNTISVKYMNSMFSDCQSLTSLDLSSFITSSVQNMGYLFYFCTSLKIIKIPNFDTSKILYMNSMFECCHSLTSLDISHFKLSSVTNFNYMFEHCYSLNYLNISDFLPETKYEIYADSVFSRIDKNFKYCLRNNEKFFNIIYNYNYANRDCTNQCYPNNKLYIPSSKTCTDNCQLYNLYEYNNECIYSCPKRMKANSNNTCELLNCPKYYNYYETDCIDEIPDRYYLKDEIQKTIDECPIECKKCDKEGIVKGLCISCNIDYKYYPKYNDSLNINSYIKCYQTIQGYYLDYNISLFLPCYHSCLWCSTKGDDERHFCSQCNNDYQYYIDFGNYINCYQSQTYYYLNRNINSYFFIHNTNCPTNYSKLIPYKNQCIEECYLDGTFNFEFKNECYQTCPYNTKISEYNNYYCEPLCSYDKPFEILSSQECVKNCEIVMLYKNLCRFVYNNENINPFSDDLILNNIRNDLITPKFNFSEINNNSDIIIVNKNSTFTITTENKNIRDLDECEFILRNFYNISNENMLYKLIKESIGKAYHDYEIYYSFNGINLEKLNLDLCNYKCQDPKCSSCTQRSVFYNQCVTCNNNYYPILNDSSNLYYYIKCYQNPEGYYLDIYDSFYKPCYNSCKTCDIKGAEELHNCLICKSEYYFELNYDNYTNCYDKCKYYYYFDNKTNKYYCTKEAECPEEYNKLILDKNQCIGNCQFDEIYKYEFRNKCYSICPDNTQISDLKKNYYCDPICSKERPFEIIEYQECVNNCSISEFNQKICRLNYNKKNNKYLSDYLIKEIENENFNYTKVYDGENILIEEKYSNFTITTENIDDILECENILRNYYNISTKAKVLKLKNEYIENTISKTEYNLFYKLNEQNLIQLDLSICTCKENKCSLCSNTSMKYNLCIFCNKNYFPIEDDSSNINPYINCYQNPEGYYLDIYDSLYKPCYNSCKACDIKGDEELHNCLICKSEYYFELNYDNYTNCYDKCKYYNYFDNKTNKYYCTKKAECPKEYSKLRLGNNQCIEDCSKDEIYKYEFQKKCYSKCPSNTEKQNFNCKVKCPKEYPFELVNTQECVSNCSISDRQKKLCISNYISNDTDSSSVQDEVINNIKEDLTKGFDTSNIDKGENIVIEEKGTKLTITNTANQKNSENDKYSTTINLGECETKLKEHYKIPLDDPLYILKIDVEQKGMKIPKIEYEVYYNLNGKNLEQLNLSICQNTKIDISIPVEITEDLDKLNSSSAYFNDICYTSTSDSGTDISLADRKKEFTDNNKTLCEENCDFTKYNYETGKAVCSCGIKINIPKMSEISFDKNKLFDSFTDINNIINYKIMKCYKNLLKKDGFKKNYGSFILIPLFIFHIICLISACASGNRYLKKQIKEIIIAKNNFKYIETRYLKYLEIKKTENNNKKRFTKPKKKMKEKNINENMEKKIINQNNEAIIKKIMNLKKKKKKKKISSIKSINIDDKTKSKNFKPKKELTIKLPNNSKINQKENNDNADDNSKNILEINKLKLKNNNYIIDVKKYKKYKDILKLNENEMNSLSYNKAILLDKRSYCEFFVSLLKTNHLLLFSFVTKNDYNLRIIKIDLFFIIFITNYAVNALFFNDNTMHKIYEDEGKFNLTYQIPQIIYSSLISGIFSTILKMLALTENIVLEIKHQKEIKNIKSKKEKSYKIINLKFIFFCITSIIMLTIFFYYIACFCAIYKNTQIHLIKDSMTSFGLSLLYPFITFLFPGILRIPALKNKKNKREILYKISKFVQMII